MSSRNAAQSDQAGFTLVELLVTLVMVVMVGITFLVIFKSTLFNFINMQADASSSVQLNTQANRVATVLRSVTGINSAAADDLVVYAYFYPSDSYVSLLHYYLQTSGKVTKLMADLTPMSANPPLGTPITAQKRTFTIIDNYYQASGVSLFTYLDASGSALAVPITDLQTIKGVQVTLTSKMSNNANQTLSVQVSLRNRKTNL